MKPVQVAIRYEDGSGRVVELEREEAFPIENLLWRKEPLKRFSAMGSMPPLAFEAPEPTAFTAPLIGTKANPFRDTIELGGCTYSTLHPRVLNDYSLPKGFRDAAFAIFSGKHRGFNTGVDIVGPVEELVVQDPAKGTYHVEQRVSVRTDYWPDGKFTVKVKVRDLMGRSVSCKAEQRLYRAWKDAQLKEAKQLTKKRIMAALAGPEDAQFKMGDRVNHAANTKEYVFIGYVTGTAEVILLGPNGGVVIAARWNLTKAQGGGQ